MSFRVLFIGHCPLVLKHTLEYHKGEQFVFEYTCSLNDVIRSMEVSDYLALVLLSHEALPVMKVLHHPNVMLYSPWSDDTDVRIRAQDLGVKEFYSTADDLSRLLGRIRELQAEKQEILEARWGGSNQNAGQNGARGAGSGGTGVGPSERSETIRMQERETG